MSNIVDGVSRLELAVRGAERPIPWEELAWRQNGRCCRLPEARAGGPAQAVHDEAARILAEHSVATYSRMDMTGDRPTAGCYASPCCSFRGPAERAAGRRGWLIEWRRVSTVGAGKRAPAARKKMEQRQQEAEQLLQEEKQRQQEAELRLVDAWSLRLVVSNRQTSEDEERESEPDPIVEPLSGSESGPDSESWTLSRVA